MQAALLFASVSFLLQTCARTDALLPLSPSRLPPAAAAANHASELDWRDAAGGSCRLVFLLHTVNLTANQTKE